MYFLSRVAAFTPVTASCLGAERVYTLKTVEEVQKYLYQKTGREPLNFEALALADSNHGYYWPERFVHAVAPHKRFLNCDEGYNQVIPLLCEAAERNGDHYLGDRKNWQGVNLAARLDLWLGAIAYLGDYDGIILEGKYVLSASMAIIGPYYCGSLGGHFEDTGSKGLDFLHYTRQDSEGRSEVKLSPIGESSAIQLGYNSDYLSSCPYEDLWPSKKENCLRGLSKFARAHRHYSESWSLP